MFDLIHNFILNNLLSTASTDSNILSLNSSLAIILTHVSIVLIFICFIRLLVFCFHLFHLGNF